MFVNSSSWLQQLSDSHNRYTYGSVNSDCVVETAPVGALYILPFNSMTTTTVRYNKSTSLLLLLQDCCVIVPWYWCGYNNTEHIIDALYLVDSSKRFGETPNMVNLTEARAQERGTRQRKRHASKMCSFFKKKSKLFFIIFNVTLNWVTYTYI